MKIAIHPDDTGFSGRWIERCEARGVAWKRVNCYASDIVQQLADCDALMWHWHQLDAKAWLFARQLTQALEAGGKHVFPNRKTAWHFDDKVGQKYLLESVGAPFPETHVFYDEDSALAWLAGAPMPQVFKLRGGSGSTNVYLVRTRADAVARVKQAFGRGHRTFDRHGYVKEKLRLLRRDKTPERLKAFVRSTGRLVVPYDIERVRGFERGYAYFQQFLPGNEFDTRVVAIGGRAFALRRRVRPDDFRASGSADMHYAPEDIDLAKVKVALDLADRLESQCLAVDLVDGPEGPMVLELSYGFPTGPFLDDCPGYWDRDLVWHAGRQKAQSFMVDDLVAAIEAG